MRTTPTLDQDVLQALQPSVQGLAPYGEIPVLPRLAGAQPVTSAAVKDLLEFED